MRLDNDIKAFLEFWVLIRSTKELYPGMQRYTENFLREMMRLWDNLADHQKCFCFDHNLDIYQIYKPWRTPIVF